MEATVNTGRMIKNIIEQKNLLPTKMAVSMGIPNTAIYAYEKRASIQTNILIKLCHAAKHNFFKDIGNLFPSDYTQDAASSNELEMVALKKELERLTYENTLMRDLLKSK